MRRFFCYKFTRLASRIIFRVIFYFVSGNEITYWFRFGAIFTFSLGQEIRSCQGLHFHTSLENKNNSVRNSSGRPIALQQ